MIILLQWSHIYKTDYLVNSMISSLGHLIFRKSCIFWYLKWLKKTIRRCVRSKPRLPFFLKKVSLNKVHMYLPAKVKICPTKESSCHNLLLQIFHFQLDLIRNNVNNFKRWWFLTHLFQVKIEQSIQYKYCGRCLEALGMVPTCLPSPCGGSLY